ncbi:hypothetical protein PENSPDRAFT_750049 [Peniophora sp. CONT]|nr:hypothetical protein PENSPDRAFT_750049 [Peniophora sp. CONT]
MLIPHSYFVLPIFCLITSSSVQTPSGWREPSFRISQIGKTSVAKAALDVLVAGLDPSTGMVTDPSPGLGVPQSATFMQTLSRYDQLTGGAIYEITQITLHSDTVRWGLAAYYASTVWIRDRDTFLDGALSAWDKAYSFQLSSSIASTGYLSSINATFQPSCNGSSVQGAVLWLETNGPEDVQTNTETMGPFIALSSYLYNATQNTTYSDAAKLAIGFMKNFLSDGQTPTHDTLYLSDCSMGLPNSNFTYNSGYFIEGLAAYTALTGDSSQKDFLNSLVENALFRTPEWYRPDGVLLDAAFAVDGYARIEGPNPDPQTLAGTRLSSDWKSIFLNGLYTCVRFGLLDETLEVSVRALIAVQYNAIRELANTTVNNQIVYSPSWDQQPLQVLAAWGQLTAAEMFTMALNVTTSEDTTTDASWTSMPGSPNSTFNSSGPTSTISPHGVSPTTETPPPPSTSTTSTTSTTTSSSPSHASAIAGGIVGGALAAFVILIVALCRRRQRRRMSDRLRRLSLLPEPYTGTIHQYPSQERTAIIMQTADSSGRLVKLEPMREANPTPAASGSSGPNNHSTAQLLREEATPVRTSGTERLARAGRHERVEVDAGLLRRLLVGIREAHAELSALRRRQEYGRSQFSDPPVYARDSA